MDCFYCSSFKNKTPLEVAHHIFEAHPSKRRGWATKVLTNVENLNRKADFQKSKDRMPLTEEEKEAKRSTQRELSGREHTVFCRCPRCNQLFQEKIPIEFLTSNTAWKSHNGEPIVNCENCNKKKH